jgi:hypothetical protein
VIGSSFQPLEHGAGISLLLDTQIMEGNADLSGQSALRYGLIAVGSGRQERAG